MNILLMILFLGAQGLWAQTSYVPATRVLYDKGYQLQFGGDIFQTSQVINADGTRHSLIGDENFTRYQAEFNGFYGLTHNLQVGLGGRFRHHESSVIDNNGNTINSNSSGFQSLAAYITYAFRPVGSLHYALEGIFRYTPYTNNEVTANSTSTTLILGDDGNEYSGGLAVSYIFVNQNVFTARGGYRRPGTDLSDELYWQAELALVWKYFALIGGVDGVSSLGNDNYTGADRPVFNTGNSALYTGENRQWIAPYLGMNIALGNLWRVEFKAAQVIDGQSTDIGQSYGLQLIRRVEAADPNKLPDAKFKSYDIEGNVTKVSPKKEYVVIDKGLSDEVEKGMSFDFYEFDYVGGNVLVARGTVVSSKSDSAVIKITQRYNRKKEIKEGIIARGALK